MIKIVNLSFILLTLLLISSTSFGQIETSTLSGKDPVNSITTAVPFLLIVPESRGGAMGDVGAATSPDVNSLHYNPAKMAFIKDDMGFSFSYTPWLRALINDISLLYVTGYYRINKNQTLAGSLRYFSLGDITFTDVVGNVTGNFNPNEFAFDFAYSRRLSKKLSGAIAIRYIYSNLTGGQYIQGKETHPGRSLALDLSVYYQDKITLLGKDGIIAIGTNISNIGSKISYADEARKDFSPTNLKIGSRLTSKFNKNNKLLFAFDINKLLVPSPAVYTLNENGDNVIEYGMDPNVSVLTGMYHSFYDAPGVIQNNGGHSVWQEEFHEINYSLGVEYWLMGMFAFRYGYFFEHPTKGNREFFTFGAGIRIIGIGLDISYLYPTQQRHPLNNTFRFTLKYNFEKSKNKAFSDIVY